MLQKSPDIVQFMTKFDPVNGFFASSHIQEENDKIKDGGGDLHTLSLPPGPDHPCSRSNTGETIS